MVKYMLSNVRSQPWSHVRSIRLPIPRSHVVPVTLASCIAAAERRERELGPLGGSVSQKPRRIIKIRRPVGIAGDGQSKPRRIIKLRRRTVAVESKPRRIIKLRRPVGIAGDGVPCKKPTAMEVAKDVDLRTRAEIGSPPPAPRPCKRFVSPRLSPTALTPFSFYDMEYDPLLDAAPAVSGDIPQVQVIFGSAQLPKSVPLPRPALPSSLVRSLDAEFADVM